MTGEGPVDPLVRDAIAELWEEAHGTAMERVLAVETYLADRLTGPVGDDELEVARRSAHQMAGTLGTFGLTRGSEIGAAIESGLDDGHPADEDLVALAELAVELRGLLEAAAPEPRPDPSTATDPADEAGHGHRHEPEHDHEDGSLVALVGPDRSFVESTAFELRRRGLLVRRVRGAPVGPADLVVVDLGADGSCAAVAVDEARAGAPVVVTGVADELTLRSELVSSGALAMFDPGAHPGEVADLVRRLADLRYHSARVGVLDDRTDVASVLAAGLAVNGLDVDLLDGPSAVVGPPAGLGVVVIGGTMSAERVAELVRLVRGDPRWGACSVLALAPAELLSSPAELLSSPAELLSSPAEPVLVAAGADAVMEASAGASEVAERARTLLVRRALTPAAAEAPAWRPPVDPARASLQRGADDPRRGGADAGTEVLVVEDDPTMSALLERVLTSHGWQVRVIPDGLDAVEVLVDHEAVGGFALVLLDISLPGLDGFGVLGRMREAGTLRAVPVVVLTARSRDDEVVRALEIGASDHVAKPVSVDVLLQRMDRVLHRTTV